MKFLNALVSVSTAAVAMTILSQGASAANLTQAEYDAQLGDKYGLSYDQWSLFNEVATTEERVALDNADINSLLLEDLTWETGAEDIEIFFINEGAGIQSDLLYSTDGGTLQTLWDDISSPNSVLPETDGLLSLGEGLNLGSFASGTILDLVLEADDETFRIDPELNEDGLPHVTAYESNGFLLLGFEDRTGELNDGDFNDVVIAIKGLPDTADVPEPMGTTALLGMGMLGLMRLRRR
ncbi:MAG: DUF4114 domain-containing protein [Cyanobacteria bacterium J06642_11]